MWYGTDVTTAVATEGSVQFTVQVTSHREQTRLLNLGPDAKLSGVAIPVNLDDVSTNNVNVSAPAFRFKDDTRRP